MCFFDGSTYYSCRCRPIACRDQVADLLDVVGAEVNWQALSFSLRKPFQVLDCALGAGVIIVVVFVYHIVSEKMVGSLAYARCRNYLHVL